MAFLRRIPMLFSILLMLIVFTPSYAKEAKFDDAVIGFTIDVPNNWTSEYPPGGGSENIPALVVNSPDGGSSDPYIENLTAGVVVLSTKVDKNSLRKKMNRSDELMKSVVKDYKVHSVSRDSIEGMPAEWKIKSFTYPQSNRSVKQLSLTIGYNNILYILVFSSTPSEFDKHEETFRTMATTFRKSK